MMNEKKNLTGTAKIAKIQDAFDDCHYLTFKLWTKGDKKRVYINDYKRRTLGYIEGANVIINDRQGNSQSEIDFAVKAFNETYTF